VIAERRYSLQKVESLARKNHRSGVARQDKRGPLQSAGSDECHSARDRLAEQTVNQCQDVRYQWRPADTFLPLPTRRLL